MLQEHPEIRAEHHNLEQLKTADRLELSQKIPVLMSLEWQLNKALHMYISI